MGNVSGRTVVRTVSVRGRAFDIELTTWRDSDRLSFDVKDVATGTMLTPESLDSEPGVADVESLLAGLERDLADGTLDPFFDGTEDALRSISCRHLDQMVSENDSRFHCHDCGADLGR